MREKSTCTRKLCHSFDLFRVLTAMMFMTVLESIFKDTSQVS